MEWPDSILPVPTALEDEALVLSDKLAALPS